MENQKKNHIFFFFFFLRESDPAKELRRGCLRRVSLLLVLVSDLTDWWPIGTLSPKWPTRAWFMKQDHFSHLDPVSFIYLFFKWNINVTELRNTIQGNGSARPLRPSSAPPHADAGPRRRPCDQAAHGNGCQVIVARRYGDGARARLGSWKEVWKTRAPIVCLNLLQYVSGEQAGYFKAL